MKNVGSVIASPLVFAEPLEDTRTYGGSRQLFRDTASAMGVEITKQEDYDWAAVLEASMLVDQLADVTHVDIVAAFEDILTGNFQDSLSPDVQARTINYYSRQPRDSKVRLLSSIRKVSELTAAQRDATRPADVVDIRIAEADILANLLHIDTSNTDEGLARHTFNTWINSWSRVGYLIDSFVDIDEDYRDGNSGVKPNIQARVCYGLAASKEAVPALRRTPKSLLAQCALNGIHYILKRQHVDVQA